MVRLFSLCDVFDVMFVVADSTVLWANETLLTSIGYVSEEYIGHNVRKVSYTILSLLSLVKIL